MSRACSPPDPVKIRPLELLNCCGEGPVRGTGGWWGNPSEICHLTANAWRWLRPWNPQKQEHPVVFLEN
jgi:hypothetical protein